MVRLATALFGMTISSVLLVTRGTANLMEGKKRWSKEQATFRNNSMGKILPFCSTLPYIIINVAALLKWSTCTASTILQLNMKYCTIQTQLLEIIQGS
jgi:Mn2+/Fe2+ NRAMP family transporter